MFYVSCKQGNQYGVRDTDDNSVEMYSIEELSQFIQQGIKIGGISKLSGGGIFIRCKSEDVFNEFIGSIKHTLAKLKMLGIVERNEVISKIQDFALSYGLIQSKEQLKVDVDSCRLFIKSPAYNTFIDFESKSTIQRLDVCDKQVAKLSRLGEEALENITLKVGSDLVITLKDVLNEINKVERTAHLSNIYYIGITPSNRMFKIIKGVCVYSLKVDTIEKVRQNKDKILGTKIDKRYGFTDYIIKEVHGDSKFLISKFSLKNISAYDGIKAIKTLKNKYPTLHDVYFSKEALEEGSVV